MLKADPFSFVANVKHGGTKDMLEQRGFTIVETLLASALLGVLGVAAVVMSPSAEPIRVISAARQIQNDIEYAKQNAMMTGVTSGVVFKKFNGYTVYQSTKDTPLTDPLTRSDMVVSLLADDYPNVKINTNYTVEFNSFGTPTTGGGDSIEVTDGTNSKTILVASNTGRVKIQ